MLTHYKLTREQIEERYKPKSRRVGVGGKPKATAQAPAQEWPAWVWALAALSGRRDVGAGDTVARLAAKFGDEAFQTWYRQKFGKNCGCQADQRTWNSSFKYPTGSFKRLLFRSYALLKTLRALLR